MEKFWRECQKEGKKQAKQSKGLDMLSTFRGTPSACILAYLRSCVLLEKLQIVQPLKNFSAFYVTRRFITVFTRALHWSLSWARSNQSITSHPISLRPILIFSTHQYPICIPLLSYSWYMPCPSHPPWLDHSNYIWRGLQIMKRLIMQFSPISRHVISLQSRFSP
jgi:hypothetical protein